LTYVDGADEVLVLRKEVRQDETPDDGEKPCAEEALPCLLGRDLDERSPAESDAAEVGPYVVGNDHGDGQNEPDESFENVVNDKVRLADDQEQSHVRPGKLGELEFVVPLLEREDEEDESYVC
jgi:hypothetical protein